MAAARASRSVTCHPATPSRWPDVERLFGERGACAGCWCMWLRLPSDAFARGRGAGNRRALKRLVSDGARPGIIAYRGGDPVGWGAIAPREQYQRLERFRGRAPLGERAGGAGGGFFVAA